MPSPVGKWNLHLHKVGQQQEAWSALKLPGIRLCWPWTSENTVDQSRVAWHKEFRASSADVSEFTDVAVSFINTLTDQATETVTIRTFSNQKPWVDRSIRDAVNHRTALYNAGLLSGNMSNYKTLCYALHRAVRAVKLRYRERIESHFQLNDSRRMWQGLKTICFSGNNSSAEVRADPLLAEELNTFYGRFECNGGATADLRVRKQQTEQRCLCYHLFRGRRSEGTKESERQESCRTWWDYWPRSEVLCWSACWFVYFHL